MKVRIIYTWKELTEYIKTSFKSFLTGLCRIAWIIALLGINAAVNVYKLVVWAIRQRPCLAVLVTFCIMLAVNMFTYCSVKTRLITAEWQRDKAVMQRDSIHEAISETAEYSRIK